VPALTRSRRRTALALSLALVSVTGCSADLDLERARSSAQAQAEAIVDDVRRAVEEAKQRSRQQTGDVQESAPETGAGQIRTDTQTAFDYGEYQQNLELTLGLLDQYWSQALPEALGAPYSPPSRYVYYRPEEQPGPSCGGEQSPPRNAFYCPAGDFIAWDESGLMIPYYVSAGDFAASFVLAHEFGHAMQFRLPQQEQLGVLRELQADCFAGAWSRWVQDGGYLAAGDLDEATLAVFSARDVPGTAFTDPRAHGTGFERTRAFTDGFESGPAACYPAPGQEWLVTRANETAAADGAAGPAVSGG
jgi:predicted metalloprotease